MSDVTAASQPAPVAAPVAQSEVNPEQNVAAQPVEDVEIELDQDMRFKKSELRDRIKRQKELEKGSYERFQQAAQIRKQTEALIQAAKTNPAEFLRQTGVDPEEFAKSYVQDRIKYYEMTPTERQLMEANQKLSEYEEEKLQSSKKQEQQVYQQKVEQFQEYFDNQFSQAMTQVNLPKTPQAVKRMAEKLEVYLSNGVPVDIIDVAREIKQDYIDEYNSTLNEWDDESFDKALGEKARERVRMRLTQDVKSPLQRKQSTTQREPSSRPNSVRQVMGNRDIEKLFAKKFGR